MVWAVSLFSVTWLRSRPDASPRTCQRGRGIPQPTPGSPHDMGRRQPSASLAGSRWLGSGTRLSPRVGMGVPGGTDRVAGARGALPSAPCPQVYVLKRPHVDEFLQRMGELFECVLFTASLAKVGAPPATAIALPFPATPRVARLPSAAHPWASVAPRPLCACRQCLPLPGAGQGN